MSCENENNNAMPENLQGEIDYNTSGRGSGYPIPDNVTNRFNWGAYCFNWVWGIFNKSYKTFWSFAAIPLSIIPFFGKLAPFAFSIWFGIKGNEWAWQNKRFESIEAFHRYQRKWAIASLIVMVVLPLALLALVIPILRTNTAAIQTSVNMKKALNDVENAVLLNEAMSEKCDLTSSGLAECFANRMNGSRAGNMVFANNDTEYTFESNGICENKGDCRVRIKVGENGKNNINISLYVKPDGTVFVDKEEIENYKK